MLAAFTFRSVRTALLVIVGLLIMWLTVSWVRKTARQEDEEEAPALERMTIYRSVEMTLYRSGEAA